MDALLADRLLADGRAEIALEVLDAFLHDVLGRAGARGDQHGLDAAEPLLADLGNAVDQVSRLPSTLAISASRRLLELFWLPSTSTRSACAASSRTASWRFWVA